jgi:hypothetical protein
MKLLTQLKETLETTTISVAFDATRNISNYMFNDQFFIDYADIDTTGDNEPFELEEFKEQYNLIQSWLLEMICIIKKLGVEKQADYEIGDPNYVKLSEIYDCIYDTMQGGEIEKEIKEFLQIPENHIYAKMCDILLKLNENVGYCMAD